MCVCARGDSWALGFKDKYYLGLFGAPVFERLNLLRGKSILKPQTTIAGSWISSGLNI